MLTFDKDTHTYRWNGTVVLSTTQVIGEWVLVDSMYVNRFHPERRIAKSAMDSGADRGNAIHDACDILLTSDLDWDALDPSLVHPLREFVRWFYDYGATLVSLGTPMYSKKHGYAGTPDPLFKIKFQGHERLCLLDIKSGGHDLVGPQTAAYEQLYRETNKYRGVIIRACLYLPAQGPFDFSLLYRPDDWRFFQACLDQKNYLNAK